MKIKHILFIIAVLTLGAFASCGEDNGPEQPKKEQPDDPKDDPKEDPKDDPKDDPVANEKPKAMWIDVHANYQLLSSKANIDAELTKIKNHGMNMIYLDVKSSNGYALYRSDFLPYCDVFAGMRFERDYDDYLAYFIQKGEELGIDVVASVVATGWGYQDQLGFQEGFVFDNWAEWGDKVQVRDDAANPDILVPITEDFSQPIVVLDPVYPEVQDLMVRTVKELAAKYPKLKGISLDYLRYNNNDGGWYGLAEANLKGYAAYWGEEVPDRHEIITPGGGVGPKFQRWLEYRSMLITNTLAKIRTAIKEVNPDCELHLWASGHWGSRYTVGQNWASKRFKPSGYVYTDTYSRTGFADLLDVFITGAYAETVWNYQAPGQEWTVENFCRSWNTYIMDDCKCYGSIAAYALDSKDIADATYLCLKYTDGYMNFELSHCNNTSMGDRWLGTHNGIQAYELEPK